MNWPDAIGSEAAPTLRITTRCVWTAGLSAVSITTGSSHSRVETIVLVPRTGSYSSRAFWVSGRRSALNEAVSLWLSIRQMSTLPV